MCPAFWIKGFRDHGFISLSDTKVYKLNLFAQDFV